MKKWMATVVAGCALAGTPAGAGEASSAPAKDLVVFYSFSGKTAVAAQALAEKLKADLLEIEDETKPTEEEAYGTGRDAAVAGKSWPVKPFNANVSGHERIYIGFPVWFGMPPPAINAFVEQVNFSGQSVVVFATMNSGGHQRAIQAATDKIAAKGGRVVSSFSIRTCAAPDEEIARKAQEAVGP